MDFLVCLIVKVIVWYAKFAPVLARWGIGKFDMWEKGKKLKILLVGYNGARNTGADVRVSTIVKQLHDLLGKENIEISVLTQDIESFSLYFDGTVKLVKYNSIFFRDLYKECCIHHMVVLCEGSTLKSKFSNALTLFFCQAAGIMKMQNKPCIAYGTEAGEMDGFIQRCAAKLCSKTYFIARTEASLDIIRKLGMAGHLGTDTAWTFNSQHMDQWALSKLQESGWDGIKPLLGIAVINPFWWPVKPSILRYVKACLSGKWCCHYSKWYFFRTSNDIERKLDYYLRSVSGAVERFIKKHDVHPVIIAMEALDTEACNRLKSLNACHSTIFTSKENDGYKLSAILRRLSFLITSRYHARVLSMAVGVPAVAVSMDERIDNIYSEIGHKESYYLRVDEENLEEKLFQSLEQAYAYRQVLSEDIMHKMSYYYKTLDDMGIFFYKFIESKFPEINIRMRAKHE